MQEKIATELERALQTLRVDIERAEVWIGALKGCASPVPDYESPFRKLKIPPESVRFSRTD